MSENVFVDVLSGILSIDELTDWLKNGSQAKSNAKIAKYECNRGDFLSYFLNFVHEKAIINESNGETPQKIHTPKSIRKQEVRTIEQRPHRRRAPLFSHSINENIKHTDNKPMDRSSILNSSRTSMDFSKNRENFSPGNTSKAELLSSTPKGYSDHSFNNSKQSFTHMSPNSPLYNRLSNFSTPKNGHKRNSFNSSHKGADRSSPNICLGDFIVAQKSSGKKKGQRSLNENSLQESDNSLTNKKSRRINPTNLNIKYTASNSSFQKTENSFNFQENIKEVSPDNTEEQRSIMAEERKKIATISLKTPNKIKLSIIQNRLETAPSVEFVTFKQELEVLVSIYTFILLENMVLSICSEVYFLVSVLLNKKFDAITNATVRSVDENGESDSFDKSIANLRDSLEEQMGVLNLFGSVHNTIYFAANVLGRIPTVLQFLDGSTVRLILENKRFLQFCQSVPSIGVIRRQPSESSLGIYSDQGPSNVCYNSDTDNRENFPNEPSFHAFRKQRDLFYEILTFWDQNHMLSGWSFAVALSGKVKTLLMINSCSSNYRHLAKLFKAQLIGSCTSGPNKEEGVPEQQLAFLSSIPNLDADKLNRLKSRLVTKERSNGMNVPPGFHGVQEFYKEFIDVATSFSFNEHLKAQFVAEIADLNESKFDCNDFDDEDVTVDITTRNRYFKCLKTLRISAKFLGYLEALPFKTDAALNDKVLDAELESRKHLRPQIDIRTLLIESISKNTLVLTIPWLTEYIAMLDYVTIRHRYFLEVFEILYQIYSRRHRIDNSKMSSILIYFNLGWLFELPHFPSEHYFSWLSKYLPADVVESSPIKMNGVASISLTKSYNLDFLDMVDQRVLYLCCPFLVDIKVLLQSNNKGSKVTSKHITPLTDAESTSEIAEKRIKMQLEENFFNSQPISTRKTVDFVSERVASACVKKICNRIVPDYKKFAIANFKAFLATLLIKDNKRSYICAQLTKKGNDFSDEHLKKLKLKTTEESEKMAHERIGQSIHLLMSSEELPQVKEVCVFIAKRLCLEKVQQWQNSHLNKGIFTKEFDVESQKFVTSQGKCLKEKPLFQLPPSGRKESHNPDTLHAFKLAEILRKFTWDLESRKHIDENPLEIILTSIEKSYEERCDINDTMMVTINKMVLDAVLMMIARKPLFFQKKTVQLALLKFWKQYEKEPEDLFKTIICPRNVMMMHQSENLEQTWETYGSFISFILKEKLLSSTNFEAQCLGIYKADIDQVTQKLLSKCLRTIWESKPCDDDSFAFLLSFLSEFCEEL